MEFGHEKNMIVTLDVLSLGFVGGWFCYKKLHIFNPSPVSEPTEIAMASASVKERAKWRDALRCLAWMQDENLQISFRTRRSSVGLRDCSLGRWLGRW